MPYWTGTRRELGRLAAAAAAWTLAPPGEESAKMEDKFPIRSEELGLRALQTPGKRALAFGSYRGAPDAWRRACRRKLAGLLGYTAPKPGTARRVRSTTHEDIRIEAWVMDVAQGVRLPAYLLIPPRPKPGRALMAIHGHGEAEPCLGARDDYHHAFALRAAQAGHMALCPELRGFGALADMTRGSDSHWLDYWDSRRGRQFTLVTDTFLYGRTLIGQTVEDLVRWEEWLARERLVREVDVAGISYGGDLAITYPAFSRRVRSIYCSGSMGSFSAVFARCYNAPAHCIPGVLQWMDRSDIAGLSAPTPLRIHYGALDRPGPDNASAAYNETVEGSLAELKAVYRAFGAPEKVSLRVTPDRGHEMENDDLMAFLA
jgi:dienelactone hydrolase